MAKRISQYVQCGVDNIQAHCQVGNQLSQSLCAADVERMMDGGHEQSGPVWMVWCKSRNAKGRHGGLPKAHRTPPCLEPRAAILMHNVCSAT